MSNTARSPHPQGEIDVTALMDDIRSRVKAELAGAKSRPIEFRAQAASFDGKTTKAGEMLHSEERSYLNHHVNFPKQFNPESIVSHRPGLIGKLIVRIKRKFSLMLREAFLKDYLDAEAEFHVNLVRFLNQFAHYVDHRDGDNFWQLIKKVDYDVGKALERGERSRDDLLAEVRGSERSLRENLAQSVQELNQALGQALGGVARHDGQLQALDSVTKGLEGIVAKLTRSPQAYAETGAAGSSVPPADQRYLLLENRFRGSEEEIRARLQAYVEEFRGAKKPLLEVGCGRGELLQLLKESSVPAKGIDLDPAMVERCVELGLDARQADVIEFLQQSEDGSFGGLIAVQVVEHLPLPVLTKFIELASKKVAPGGKIIFETINPTSMLALSSNYFRDPTHVFPQHPDTLAYACTLNGLEIAETRLLSPVPEGAQLRELKEDSFMTPHWAQTVQLFNHNIRILNSLLFGHQDFCIIARVKGN